MKQTQFIDQIIADYAATENLQKALKKSYHIERECIRRTNNEGTQWIHEWERNHIFIKRLEMPITSLYHNYFFAVSLIKGESGYKLHFIALPVPGSKLPPFRFLDNADFLNFFTERNKYITE